MGSKTKTSTTTAQSTTPTAVEPYSSSFQGYTGQVDDFLAMDPTQFVAPTSGLQTQAFNQATQPDPWAPYLSQANSLATGYANLPTNQVTAAGYNAPQINGSYTFDGAQLGDANTFDGAQLGDPSQMQSAQLGAAPNVDLGGYDMPQLGDAAFADWRGLLNDPTRLRDYMQDYQNPYGQQVIDSTMADYDEYAGTQRAAQDAQAGLTDAFGGSRYGIQEGQLEGELARGRASTLSGLRDQQYRLSAQLAGQDMDASNQFALTRAGMGLESAFANQNAYNQFGLARFGAGIDQARYGADAANQGELANQAMSGQYGLQQGAYDQQASLANQDAMNNFLMQQGLLDQQTGAMNMDALNQFAMQQGLLDQQTGMYNTDTLNNFLMTQVGLDADAAKYYADSLNQASTTNAGLYEQSYLRDLQAAGLIGDLGQTSGQLSLADLGMTAELGGVERGIASETTNAYPTQLQLAGNLYSQLYPGLYTGTDMTGTGTSTSKTSGLGTWLPQLAGSAMQAGAVAFSDRRLKTNIKLVSRDPDGLGWYDYDIFGTRQRGVMADEVKKLRPQAYIENYRDGYAGVNYARLMETQNG